MNSTNKWSGRIGDIDEKGCTFTKSGGSRIEKMIFGETNIEFLFSSDCHHVGEYKCNGEFFLDFDDGKITRRTLKIFKFKSHLRYPGRFDIFKCDSILDTFHKKEWVESIDEYIIKGIIDRCQFGVISKYADMKDRVYRSIQDRFGVDNIRRFKERVIEGGEKKFLESIPLILKDKEKKYRRLVLDQFIRYKETPEDKMGKIIIMEETIKKLGMSRSEILEICDKMECEDIISQ
jgi:hypothetical protein